MLFLKLSEPASLDVIDVFFEEYFEGRYTRQRHCREYASSGNILKDDACSRPPPPSPSFPRTQTWLEISAFGGHRGGSRVAPYTPTLELDSGTGTQPGGKLESIAALPIYEDKSHEELRWEDYQLGDKGGPSPAGAIGFGASSTQSSPFALSSTFGQISVNPFSSSTSSNPFAPKTPAFGSSGLDPHLLLHLVLHPLGQLHQQHPPYLYLPSPFGSSSSSAFGSSTSVFGSSSAQGTTPSFGSGLSFGNTQSSPLFQSSTPSLVPATPAFGQTTFSFGQSTPAFGQSSVFSTPSTAFWGNLFSSTPSLLSTSNPLGFGQTTNWSTILECSKFIHHLYLKPSISTPFQVSQPSQSTGAFGFSNFGQMQSAGTSGLGGKPSIFGQNTLGQLYVSVSIFVLSTNTLGHSEKALTYVRSAEDVLSASQSSAVVQPAPVTNPFGTLPVMPQMSIGRTRMSPSIPYGISSLPHSVFTDNLGRCSFCNVHVVTDIISKQVVDKPAPVTISSLLTAWHLSQRQIRYLFFSDDEETPSAHKADALYVARENLSDLVIRPLEQWPSRANPDKTSPPKDTSTPPHGNGNCVLLFLYLVKGLKQLLPLICMDQVRRIKIVSLALNEKFAVISVLLSLSRWSVENGLVKEGLHPVNPKPKPIGQHDDNSIRKVDSYITLTDHRAGEVAIVYEHGADIEALMPKTRHYDYYTEPRIQELVAKERAPNKGLPSCEGFCGWTARLW
ncbi:unnamed protein product [Ilex paraguariensis]|uniref:Uncharacterized protein n=1 Tax=Ilex paraguariensis TaxID=185542 RepID=A0ABC8TKV5_9AQUA